ncbi:hypothetical protein [Haloplanus natans]|uniref:hypothetical protein n=1 Tax=Haloplanus natans TaxID=376171 RepID=UPI0012FC0250|nr:hypothetical protein [Haloplanus natans]
MYEQERVFFPVVELVALSSVNPFLYDGFGEFASGFLTAVNSLESVVCELYVCNTGFTL